MSCRGCMFNGALEYWMDNCHFCKNDSRKVEGPSVATFDDSLFDFLDEVFGERMKEKENGNHQ